MRVRVSYTVEAVRTRKGSRLITVTGPDREQITVGLDVVMTTKGIRLNNESEPDWLTIKSGDVLSFMSSVS